jgi:tRNA-2-methylthio-N6-dimethylallyladenosine synthase
MNERDSERIAAVLLQRGWTRAPSEELADVVIVNTCSVREKAEDKALGKLGLLASPRRRPAGRLVGAVGCMAQRLGADLLARVPGLDFAVGPQRLSALPGVLEAVRAGHGPLVETGEAPGEERDGGEHVPDGPAAFVSILFGCSRRCSYCIVPAVRGGEWSRPAAAILDEVRALAAAGVGEVTLLGQSVMDYGRRQPVWDAAAASPRGYAGAFPRLLEAVGAVPGIARVRFTSGHPAGCSAELARAMAELPAVCGHVHLPLQSASDRVLRRMRRGYTADRYRAAVRRLRAAVPALALTTDIIVGFPGETAADFEATRAFMAEVGFDNAFIFKYSPRPGTAAAAWVDDVPAEEKERRNRVLLEDQEHRCLAANRALAGQDVEVLVEGPSARNAARWTGRTRSNKIVLFDPVAGAPRGALVNVHVERAAPQTLYGRVVVP